MTPTLGRGAAPRQLARKRNKEQNKKKSEIRESRGASTNFNVPSRLFCSHRQLTFAESRRPRRLSRGGRDYESVGCRMNQPSCSSRQKMAVSNCSVSTPRCAGHGWGRERERETGPRPRPKPWPWRECEASGSWGSDIDAGNTVAAVAAAEGKHKYNFNNKSDPERALHSPAPSSQRRLRSPSLMADWTLCLARRCLCTHRDTPVPRAERQPVPRHRGARHPAAAEQPFQL